VSAFADRFIMTAPAFLRDLEEMQDMTKGALNKAQTNLKAEVKAARKLAVAAWKRYDEAKKSKDPVEIERAKADEVELTNVRVAASAAAPAAYVAASCELTFGGWRCRCT
jgi:hypothetical protein